MKRKNIIGIVALLVIAALLSGGAYYAFVLAANPDEQASTENESSVQTAVARMGDLTVFASGTGQLTSLNNTTLRFEDNGTLIEMLVNVGDEVSAGDVLARMQVTKTEEQLTAEIAKAELSVIQDQQSLAAIYEEAEIAAAQALRNLESAQDELAATLDYDLELAQAMQAVAAAEEAIEEAEMSLYIHQSNPSDEAVYTAFASLLFKEKAYIELQEQLEQLEYEYKKASGEAARRRVKAQIDRVTAQMYNQQVVYEAALYHYNNIDAPADSIDLNLAQAQMDTAQAQLIEAQQTLATAQKGAPVGEIALAEANLAQAQAEWARWKAGPDPQAVTLAEAELDISQLELEIAQQTDLIVDLLAPSGGTVMEIHADVNESIEGGEIITLADTSQPIVEIYLDEIDFQHAQIGNPVEVIFDALPDKTFTGSILEISPDLVRVSNSQVVSAQAILDAAALSQQFVLPIGLNAAVDVIAGEALDAVLIPVEALHETSTGNTIVYVQSNGGFEQREVSVGLLDFTSAEITSGLEAGEIVALGDQ